jgi:hypothetical protein
MYNFGGFNSGDLKSVSRIALALTSDREKLDDMATGGTDITVIIKKHWGLFGIYIHLACQ